MIKRLKARIRPTWNWLPDPRQMIIGRNGNYFRSVVAGCFSPLFHLPQMLWHLIIKPLANGIGVIFLYLIGGVIFGLAGMVTGIDVAVLDENGNEIKQLNS